MNIVITGGAGFIGTNLSAAMAKNGHNVTIFDNLRRKGTVVNATWLTESYPNINLRKGDVRNDHEILKDIVTDADAIYHLAGQVAVTTSVIDPRSDFEANALGTLNVLEAVRKHAKRNPAFIYSSTNKVYGDMKGIKIEMQNGHYQYSDLPKGINEQQLLDFHSPYGCSKGVADQYVRDYARIYGLNTVVFRQSCIYGPRQFGIEDQGWVAWFIIAALANKQITIYGDGMQVRDVLHVDDLIQAFKLATKNINKAAGKIYNIGGGITNTMSLLELIDLLNEYLQKDIQPTFADWRQGDQPVFISDIAKARQELGWQPTISVHNGIEQLVGWARANKQLLETVGLI